MCLLIVQTKDTNFTEEHLLDFFTRNRDGLGVMWAEDGQLHYNKIVPSTAQESVEFYNTFARGKDACVHYRMRTHGDIDSENTHPYEVFGFTEEHEMPMLLMHNGILHTGNEQDTSKSDTWHYIRNYLHRLLAADPALAFTPEFRDIIGRHIGNNKFAIMNHLGEISVVNRSQGVEFNGAWLSNEYAWSAMKFMPNKYAKAYNNMFTRGEWNPVTKRMEYGMDSGAHVPKLVAPTTTTTNGALTTSSGGETLSKNQQRKLARKAERELKKNTAAQRENMSHGLTPNCKWLDDVLEMRTILDSFYVDNTTHNRQIETMIDEMGVVEVYEALELLGDGVLSEKSWDSLSTNRTEMKWFITQNKNAWYTPKLTQADVDAMSDEEIAELNEEQISGIVWN